ARLETVAGLEAVALDEGLADSVDLVLTLAPVTEPVLEVLGRRPAGSPGSDALLEVRVQWTDFLGVAPMSRGTTERFTLPFGDDGEATREEPLRRRFPVTLEPPDARTLARRVELWARLHPVDVVGEQ